MGSSFISRFEFFPPLPTSALFCVLIDLLHPRFTLSIQLFLMYVFLINFFNGCHTGSGPSLFGAPRWLANIFNMHLSMMCVFVCMCVCVCAVETQSAWVIERECPCPHPCITHGLVIQNMFLSVPISSVQTSPGMFSGGNALQTLSMLLWPGKHSSIWRTGDTVVLYWNRA